MSTRISPARAFVDGTHVADAQVSEEWVERSSRVPLPGQNRDGHKDASYAGQAFVQFANITDDAFVQRLARLAAFATGDVSQKRAIRDAGESRLAVGLVFDDGRTYATASLSSPFTGGGVESVAFPVHLPDAA